MKVFKKFDPNENYILRLEVSMIVVLAVMSIAFTRVTQVRKVEVGKLVYAPMEEMEFVHLLPPEMVVKSVVATNSVGTRLVIEEEKRSVVVERIVKEFLFNEDIPRNRIGAIRSQKEEMLVYSIPDALAQFPNGNNWIPEYIRTKMAYPEEAIMAGASCVMEVELVIGEDGWVKGVRIVRENEDAVFFWEGIRKVLWDMPRFTPAVVGNRYVESRFIVPIEFVLD